MKTIALKAMRSSKCVVYTAQNMKKFLMENFIFYAVILLVNIKRIQNSDNNDTHVCQNHSN